MSNNSFINSSFPVSAENTSVQWRDNINLHDVSFTFAFRTVMSIYLTDEDARALHAALGASIEARAAQQVEAVKA